jgi:hypothetical protein
VTGRVDGVWHTESYVVGGSATPVDGVLFLTAGRWATLYFVPGEQGPWGSAEAGEYRVNGDRLTFLHRLVFQGGGGRRLEIDQHASREEECGVTFEGERLKISFPSGNLLQLRRAAG